MPVKLFKKEVSGKPAKPYADFPLFPHATKRWAKKIRGKLHYFGPWDDPDGALRRFLEQRDALYAGRTPRTEPDGLILRELLNRFLTSKRHLVDTGDLQPCSFADYHATCKRVADVFGLDRLVIDLAADDFERLRATLAKGYGKGPWGPVRLGNEIQRIRVLFKYAHDARLIDHPVWFGPLFKRPSKKVLRRARAANGPRMFESDELRRILDAVGQPLRAMVLLGINCGFGNADVARLPQAAVDLDKGWIDYPRPKTGVPRRCPLWPETVTALREALAGRPEPTNKDNVGLAFITKFREPWFKGDAIQVRDGEPVVSTDDPISKEFGKLIRKLGFHRPRLGFYALRHTFETVGGESLDQPAVDAIMGHARDDMASAYRERIGDDRLRRVTDHVRRWLFGRKDLPIG
jgi:integrase